jgi:uncharacterized protein YceK
MKKALWLIGLIPLLSGCSSLATRTVPAADLNTYQNVFVEHELSDGRGVDQFIMRKLQAMGYVASSGPLTMKPVEAELVVTYQDYWTFDFTTYMVELNMQVRDARTGRELAIGHYFHPSLTAGWTSDMVDPLVDRLFRGRVAPKS